MAETQKRKGKVYITISLDRSGRVVRVEYDGRKIRPRKGKPGPARRGGSPKGCEEIASVLLHELLTCRKKKDRDKPGPYPPPGTDPCCYRDQNTGEEWCWC